MANEALINRLYQMVDEIARLGGEQERTSIVPGILVADANPSDLPTGYIKIVNPRDGTYVPCLTVNGLVVSDNDLVNVLFTKGTEPIALSQSAGSPSSSIKVYQLWESDFGAVAWQTNTAGDLSNTDGEKLTLNDSTPTARITLDPNVLFSSITLFDGTGLNRYLIRSDGVLRGFDDAGNSRISWATGASGASASQLLRDSATTRITSSSGTPSTDSFISLFDQTSREKIRLLSSDSYRILFTDASSDVDINMFGVEVTGSPLVFWDESEDSFSQNKGHIITAGDLQIPDDLVHHGDPDTLRSFTDDAIEDQAGGVVMLRMTETAQNLVNIGAMPASGADVDINANDGQVFIEGSSGNVGIGIETPEKRLSIVLGAAGGILSSDVTTNMTTKDTRFLLRHYDNSEEAIVCFGGASLSTSTEARFGGGYGVQNAVTRLRFFTGANNTTLTGTENMTIDENRNVGINIAVISAKLHVDQPSTTAAIPVAIFDQADLSEEFFEFISTVGAGNPIDTAAIGTYYGKIRVSVAGVGFKYIPLHNS